VDDHIRTLERLMAAAPDGHADTRCPGETKRGFPPFATDLIEDRIVVTTSMDKLIERGDVIVSIDGVATARQLQIEEAYTSGSPQFRTVLGLMRLGRGPVSAKLGLRVRRAGTEIGVTVDRVDRAVTEAPLHAAIEQLDAGIYYVDLSRASMKDIIASMDRLAVAPGVVFDVRDRPSGNYTVLSHLLTRPDDAGGWFAMPRVIRPGTGSHPASWKTEGWNLPVALPHIAGRIAFLTGPRAVSHAESVMSVVEHYRLGAIVGGATAGTNGDIADVYLPSGCDTYMTGRLVTKLDGSRFYLIGVQPTIPASRTIGGVLAGRDEVLDRALEYVRGTR
jgi:C-terminal processing protease CtpA/Prc